MLSAVAKEVPTVRTGPLLLWLAISVGVMILTPYIAFMTLIVLYGWEDPGLLEGDGTLPIAIVLCAFVYLAACLAPVFAGRWAFPRNRTAMTIFGLLTPVLAVGAWLMFLGASRFPNLGW